MFTCSVLPLTTLPLGDAKPPPLAATMLTCFSLSTVQPWPVTDSGRYDLASAQLTCCVILRAPLLKFADDATKYLLGPEATGTRAVVVSEFAPVLSFAGSGKKPAALLDAVSKLKKTGSLAPGKYSTVGLRAYAEIETAVENIYRSLAHLMLGERLADVALWLFKHPENSGVIYTSHNDVLGFRPEGVHPAIAAALLLLSARRRLVVIEPASIDLFSREVGMALRSDAPLSQRASIQSKSNPSGAVLCWSMRTYLGGGVARMEHPILGVITEWSDAKPPRVEI